MKPLYSSQPNSTRRRFLGSVVLAALSAGLFGGCHTIPPASIGDLPGIQQKHKLHLVVPPTKDRGFAKEIERSLISHGASVTKGKLAEMPPETESVPVPSFVRAPVPLLIGLFRKSVPVPF